MFLDVEKHADLPRVGRVCRLGLATRGNTQLPAAAILAAIDRGIDYLNWCGHDDGLREAIRQLGPRREQVRIAVQLEARTAASARRELAGYLDKLQTGYLDVATYYYVESQEEWNEIVAPGGAAEALEEARASGQLRAIGLTSHQRPLAARIAETGRLDLLMIRYNAAHRGAEHDVFPTTTRLALPVVAFTCLRWGALLQPTPSDPAGERVPHARYWYRFVLSQPAVSIALMAPDTAEELAENLALLDESWSLDARERQRLVEQAERVRRHAGSFP